MKFSTAIIVSFLFIADFCAAQSGVLDISKFGGKPNSDIGQVYIEKTINLRFRENTYIYIYIYWIWIP
jgi:hypothetical protein